MAKNDYIPSVDALIFAGGTGRRMGGSPVPKQFLLLGDKPIIAYTLDQFANHPLVSGITVVCLSDWIGFLRQMVENQGYSIPVTIIPGGKTGQESRLNGVNAIHCKHHGDSDSIVLVHDGVRPLIDEATITACIDSVVQRGCTATVGPASETIAILGDGGVVECLADRGRCRLARAPQGFKTEELWSCYNQAANEGLVFIDSISLMAHYGYEIYTVDGPIENIKITTPGDYFTFKGFMDMRNLHQLWGVEE